MGHYGSKVDIRFLKDDDVFVVFNDGVLLGPVKVHSVTIPAKVPMYEVVIPACVVGQSTRIQSMADSQVFESEYDARHHWEEVKRGKEPAPVTLIDRSINGTEDDPREAEHVYTRATSMKEVLSDLCVRIGLPNMTGLEFGYFNGDKPFKKFPSYEMEGEVDRGCEIEVRFRKMGEDEAVKEPDTQEESQTS